MARRNDRQSAGHRLENGDGEPLGVSVGAGHRMLDTLAVDFADRKLVYLRDCRQLLVICPLGAQAALLPKMAGHYARRLRRRLPFGL